MKLGLRHIFVLLVSMFPTLACAAPPADLWARWEAHAPGSTATVDHRAWSDFLARRVFLGLDGIARVAYARVDRDERAALDAYLAGLQAVRVSALDRPEQLAYWINLYNALTVRVVLDAYPVASIRDIRISPGLFAVGPWGRKLARVEGEAVALDDIEHRILRPIFRDPRVHYALNCASLGCPDLAPQAFEGSRIDADLDRAARTFVNHPRGATVENGKLLVSSIYVWFKDDFGGSDAGAIAHLLRHADDGLAARLKSVRKIDDHAYDWRLNDAPGPGG